MAVYLRVRNWERYQHYKNRRPPWIKLYDELLDDHELAECDHRTRLLAVLLLLLAARLENRIVHDACYIGRRVSMRTQDVRPALSSLLSIGFIEEGRDTLFDSKALAPLLAKPGVNASKTLASRAPAHSQEAETEAEAEDREPSLSSEEPLPTHRSTNTPRGRDGWGPEQVGEDIQTQLARLTPQVTP